MLSASQDYQRASSVFAKLELVVCDDGPDSGTQELVATFGDDAYATSATRRTRHGRQLEPLPGSAETDLVNLLHNDDELLPNYVEEMLNAARQFRTPPRFSVRP